MEPGIDAESIRLSAQVRGAGPRGVPSYAIVDSILMIEEGGYPRTFRLWGTRSHPRAVNNKRQIIGDGISYYFGDAPPYFENKTFLYDNGTITDLPSGSNLINESGQIAGTLYSPGLTATAHRPRHSLSSMV